MPSIRTVVTHDGIATWVKAVENPNALVRLEKANGQIRVTDLFKRNLPSGAGSDLLVTGLKEMGFANKNTFTLSKITNKETRAAFESGIPVEQSLLVKTSIKAVQKLGLEIDQMQYVVIDGKLQDIMVKVK